MQLDYASVNNHPSMILSKKHFIVAGARDRTIL